MDHTPVSPTNLVVSKSMVVAAPPPVILQAEVAVVVPGSTRSLTVTVTASRSEKQPLAKAST